MGAWNEIVKTSKGAWEATSGFIAKAVRNRHVHTAAITAAITGATVVGVNGFRDKQELEKWKHAERQHREGEALKRSIAENNARRLATIASMERPELPDSNFRELVMSGREAGMEAPAPRQPNIEATLERDFPGSVAVAPTSNSTEIM